MYVDIGPRKLEALLPLPMSDSEIVTVAREEERIRDTYEPRIKAFTE